MANNLNNQISAFRSVNTESSITPESLGVVLQSMADVITQNEESTDTNAGTILGLQQSVKTNAANIKLLQNWQKPISSAGNVIAHFKLGEVNKVSVAFSATLLALASGETRSIANAFALPAATASSAGVMTAQQVHDLAACTTELASVKSTAKSHDASISALNTWKGMFTGNVLQTIGVGTVNKSGVNLTLTLLSLTSGNTTCATNAVHLPIATADHAGVMSAEQVQRLNRYYDHVCNMDKVWEQTLDGRVKELGNYGSEEAALNALRDPAISGNAQIIVAHLTYQKHMSMTLIQNIENDYCRQIIFNHAKVYQRAIYFTSSARDTINYAEETSCLFPDRMEWDKASHKYVFKQFDKKFNAEYTDAIPLATAETDGLMSKEDKQKLATIENKLNALLGVQH